MTAKQKAHKVKFAAMIKQAAKLRKINPKLSQSEAVKLAWKNDKISGYVGTKRDGNKTHVLYTKNIAIKKERASKKAPAAKKAPVPKKAAAKTKRLQQITMFGIAGFFDTTIIKDLDTLKKQYFKLAKKYHPDAGGTDAQFQDLQKEYDKLFKSVLNGSDLNPEQKENETMIDEAIRSIINVIINWEGLTIELVGKWLWVGSTAPDGGFHDLYFPLKSTGLSYIKKGTKPYMVYKGAESKGRGKESMEEIKKRYGSQTFKPNPNKKISGIRPTAAQKNKIKAALKKIMKGLDKRPI